MLEVFVPWSLSGSLSSLCQIQACKSTSCLLVMIAAKHQIHTRTVLLYNPLLDWGHTRKSVAALVITATLHCSIMNTCRIFLAALDRVFHFWTTWGQDAIFDRRNKCHMRFSRPIWIWELPESERYLDIHTVPGPCDGSLTSYWTSDLV